MSGALLIVLCIVAVIFGLYALFSMRDDFCNKFQEECYKSIKKRDEDFEKQEELNHAIKEWLFK